MILAAMTFAPMLGISFGDFRTAVLKFAAIIVFVDAVGLWYDEILQMMGAISSTGRRVRGTTWIWILLASSLISAMCYYLFDMDTEETGYFAVPFAIASMILGFFLKIAAVAMAASLLASSAPAPAPAPAPARSAPVPAGGTSGSSAAPTPAAPPVVTIRESELDKAIEEKVTNNRAFIREAREYNERSVRKRELKPLIQLTGDMEVSGARAIYYDLEGGKSFQPARVYVKLSVDKESRARCFAIHAKFCEQNNIPVNPAMAKDARQKYIVIDLPQ
jgi:hypothetical protein